MLVRVSAYMDPWGTAPPLDWWTTINRARAIENLAYVVASNQACSLANYPPFSWPGGSMVVDYDGRVLAQAETGPGEKIVVGPIDLAGLRPSEHAAADTTCSPTCEPRRTAATTAPFTPPGPARHGPPTIDGSNLAIEEAKAQFLRRSLTPAGDAKFSRQSPPDTAC